MLSIKKNFIPANKLYSPYCIGPTFSKMIYDLMTSKLFFNVLEIGCLHGYSTHSFVSALKNGYKFKFSICDVNFNENVLKMVAGLPVSVHNKKSIQVISTEFDFIFVDASHDIKSVSEEIEKILDCKTDTVLAHDTFINGEKFKGAVFLRKVLSTHKDYFHINYYKKIPNDQVHYGMSLFTKRKTVFDFLYNITEYKHIIFKN